MAGYNLQTIDATDKSKATGGLGHRRQSNIEGIFPSSPLYSTGNPKSTPAEGDLKLTPADYKTWFLNNVVNGVVPSSGDYYGFKAPYDRDFTGAAASNGHGPPNYAEVKTGAGGLPATAFVPNPASPGEGNGVNAEAKPAAKDFATGIYSKTPSTPGVGSAANQPIRNPAEASKAMKTLTLNQTLGQSPATTSKGK